MARPRKPAAVKAGKSETKEHLKQREAIEDEMKGNTEKIYNVPIQLDELGQEYYKFLIDELEASNILSNLDIPLLTQTSDALSKMEQADDIINEKGMIYITYDKFDNEIPKEHPAVGIKQKYLNQFRALSTQLGLSPSARASMSEMKIQAKKEDEDPVLQILKEMNG